MPVDLKFKTKIVQNNNQGHYAIYIFNDILEDDYLKELLDKTLELTEIDHMKHDTNVLGNMTTWHKMLEEPIYIKFQSIVLSYLHTCICLRSNHINVPEYDFSEFWGMQFKRGERSVQHTHLGACTWSGVFCIDSDDDAGRIAFPDMEFSDIMQPNGLYIFPSMMPHYTLPYQSDKPRVALSFNLDTRVHIKVDL
tara:strand:+ start:42 stop:626 length:585 start_codon:yes stop_codon:yes gene_type:complete